MPIDSVGAFASALERVLINLSVDTWVATPAEALERAPDNTAIRFRSDQNGPWLELAIETEALPSLAELKLNLSDWVAAALASTQSVASLRRVNVSTEPYRWFRFSSASHAFCLGLRVFDQARPPAGVLDDVDVEVEICFGATRMTLAQVAALASDQVIALDQHVDEPVDLLVNNRLFARGLVVVINNCLGFEVQEICQ